MTTDEKAHIYRTVPPWRTSDPLTHCGREPGSVAVVLTLDDAVAKWKRDGATRAAYTMCMTCIDRAKSYSRRDWLTWEADPLGMLTRDNHGPHADLAKRELHALAALAAAHPEEFAALLAAGNDLAERRSRKRYRRTVGM